MTEMLSTDQVTYILNFNAFNEGNRALRNKHFAQFVFETTDKG